jgi:hypothetical protein
MAADVLDCVDIVGVEVEVRLNHRQSKLAGPGDVVLDLIQVPPASQAPSPGFSLKLVLIASFLPDITTIRHSAPESETVWRSANLSRPAVAT